MRVVCLTMAFFWTLSRSTCRVRWSRAASLFYFLCFMPCIWLTNCFFDNHYGYNNRLLYRRVVPLQSRRRRMLSVVSDLPFRVNHWAVCWEKANYSTAMAFLSRLLPTLIQLYLLQKVFSLLFFRCKARTLKMCLLVCALPPVRRGPCTSEVLVRHSTIGWWPKRVNWIFRDRTEPSYCA